MIHAPRVNHCRRGTVAGVMTMYVLRKGRISSSSVHEWCFHFARAAAQGILCTVSPGAFIRREFRKHRVYTAEEKQASVRGDVFMAWVANDELNNFFFFFRHRGLLSCCRIRYSVMSILEALKICTRSNNLKKIRCERIVDDDNARSKNYCQSSRSYIK